MKYTIISTNNNNLRSLKDLFFHYNKGFFDLKERSNSSKRKKKNKKNNLDKPLYLGWVKQKFIYKNIF